MPLERERKAEPHRCSCGAHFEVLYLDDRQDERAALPAEEAEAACPACGQRKSLSLPAGASRTLRVELAADVLADEEGAGD